MRIPYAKITGRVRVGLELTKKFKQNYKKKENTKLRAYTVR